MLAWAPAIASWQVYRKGQNPKGDAFLAEEGKTTRRKTSSLSLVLALTKGELWESLCQTLRLCLRLVSIASILHLRYSFIGIFTFLRSFFFSFFFFCFLLQLSWFQVADVECLELKCTDIVFCIGDNNTKA